MPGQRGGKTRQEKIAIERRRSEVAELYCRGLYQWEIAERYGLDQSTISDDLAAIRKAWRDSGVRNFDEMRERELARIDHLERTYWQAWQRSCEQRSIKTAKKVTGPNAKQEAGTRVEGRDGNPEFLKGVQWCINRRCELLGLDAPKRQEVTGKDGAQLAAGQNVVLYLPDNGRGGPNKENAIKTPFFEENSP